MKDQQIRALFQAIAATHDTEIDCAEFLVRMAALAELRAGSGDVPEALRLAEEHERLCPNCREECAALAAAILAEPRPR
jgi:ATP/maltotriose-dependent transcriptional regulator MalT